MKKDPSLLNCQQPRLSENQLLIKPVRAAVCPEAVEALRQIRHPALPVLRGIESLVLDDQPSQPCFLFDFVPGTSLDQLSDEEQAAWSMPMRLRYFAELAQVLDFLHQQCQPGLMHLDIKPSNLILGPRMQPVLIDFDAMQWIQPERAGVDSGFTVRADHEMDIDEIPDTIHAPQIALTRVYAAPEQLAGYPGPASDIYALGLTLLHVLTGVASEAETKPSIDSLLAEVSPTVAPILARCLMRAPAQRFKRPAELAEALEQALYPEPSSDLALASAGEPELEPIRTAISQPESDQTDADRADSDQTDTDRADSEQPDANRADSDQVTHYQSSTDQVSSSQQPADPMTHNQSTANQSAANQSAANQANRRTVTPDDSELRDPAQLICVWDGAEFGCELAVQLRHYYAKVLVIDADLISPQADLLLGRRSRKRSLLPQSDIDNLNQVMVEIERQTLSAGRLRDLVWSTLVEQVDLLVFGANLDEYEHIPPDSLLRLLEIARLSYPVIVLLCNRFIYDAFTCLGLMTSDHVLIPVAGHAAAIRSFNRSIDFLSLRHQIDSERIRFIAFAYDERTDLSLGTLNALCASRLIGSVQTHIGRQRRRGSAKPYALSPSPVNIKEYDGIIARLSHFSRKEQPDADHHVPHPLRRTIRLVSRQTAAAQ